MALLDGFARYTLDVDGVAIHAAVGGGGPPLLLLHGYPQTHVMWHAVAPELAGEFTLVVPDLRGYGDSGKPPAGEDHAGYSKRAMAADQVGLMAALGFDRFAVAGHDRGARVAHRMCLDHPDAVTAAALLDIVPTRDIYGTADRAMATAYWHWFFLIQPEPLPERLIGGDPEFDLRTKLGQWGGEGAEFAEEAVAEYVRCFTPEAIHATCEDYRAAASIDLEHDEADLDSRIRCPLLVLWGARGFVGSRYDVLDLWRERALDVRGGPLDCGHFVPEEQPTATAAALRDFFS